MYEICEYNKVFYDDSPIYLYTFNLLMHADKNIKVGFLKAFSAITA